MYKLPNPISTGNHKCTHGSGEATVIIRYPYDNDDSFLTEWRMCYKCAWAIKVCADSRTVPFWRRAMFRLVEWIEWH